ncbi:hypothetical protein Bca52824_008298 [Brassica carinata]|uniref:Uncharacterized protein n=1 Tax=Brassica carinata TaxID=52824 RepID=A0A8X8B7Z3_BRACI|nr:hypothetical protein Bca52824_008298 [Brassica carinata]
MVSTPPSCLRPPDPPPPSFFWLMQHYSSSLKMMVTALPPPSQPGPPPDPSPNKHFPVETLSPVKPPEPADPPDVSVTTQILHLMWVSSKLEMVMLLLWSLATLSFSTAFFSVIYRSYLFNVLFL